jgi:elongation factor P
MADNLLATQLRKGMIVKIENKLFRIFDRQHVTPGNLRGFVRVKMRNIQNGSMAEEKFRSEDIVERVSLEQKEMQYLYNDGDFWHFMVPDTFEQHTAGKEAMGESAIWLKDGTTCNVLLWNGVPLAVNAPAAPDGAHP